MISHREKQDDAVGSVYICMSAECFCIDPCHQQCLCVLYVCCVLLYLEAWNCGSLASMKLKDSAIPNT